MTRKEKEQNRFNRSVETNQEFLIEANGKIMGSENGGVGREDRDTVHNILSAFEIEHSVYHKTKTYTFSKEGR